MDTASASNVAEAGFLLRFFLLLLAFPAFSPAPSSIANAFCVSAMVQLAA